MGKNLVAYFSSGNESGVTGRLAARLAEGIGADLFQITPEQAYTAADLNWQNRSSRSSVEMGNRASRPDIASRVENMAQYDTVFVGFPVWWYREPSIIDTFMESYDFSGKTVVPFATSGGSSIGDSGKNLAALAPGATVLPGKRFEASASKEKLAAWAGAWA